MPVTVIGNKLKVEVLADESTKKQLNDIRQEVRDLDSRVDTIITTPAESVSAPQGNEVKAPLAGTILSVKVKVGDRVSAGDVLLTLEALKLENEITSPVSGTVVKIASAGETVEADQVIAIIN